MKTWLNLEQVTALTGWSREHVNRLARQGTIQKRATEIIAPNGKPQPEYSLESLPADAQLKHARQFALVPAAAAETATPRTAVTPEHRAKAEERLVPVVLLRRYIDGVRPTLELPDGRPVNNSNDYAELIAPQYGLTASGLWKRYQRFYKKGEALAGARKDAGTSRVFTKYPEAAKFVLGLRTHDLNITHIHDELKLWWPNNVNHGSTPPSETTIREFLKNVPQVLLDGAKLSKEKFDQKHAPFVRTDYASHLRANQIWVSDHRIHDVFVQNDCFESRPKLCWMRVWETCIEDMRTRTIVGSAYSVTPSSRTIASALRAAIARFGLPEVFYVDNGKDYRKIGKDADHAFATPEDWDSEIGRPQISRVAEGVLGRLGIKVQYCEPRHPQSKLIESYFSFQSKRLDRYFGVAYAGQRPDRRPDACGLALKQHKLFLEGKLLASPLPLASQFIQIALYWNEEFNSGHRHSGHGMNLRPPYEVLNELLPQEQRVKVKMEEIADLFWDDRHKRMVRNCTVQLHTGVFTGADTSSQRRLYELNGEEITVACDPDDLSEAIAFDSKGDFIGRLCSQQLVARGLNRPLDEVKEIQKFRRGTRRDLMGTINAIRSGVPTPFELISERAGITTFVQPPPPARHPGRLAHAAPMLAAVNESTPYADNIVERFLKNCEEEQ